LQISFSVCSVFTIIQVAKLRTKSFLLASETSKAFDKQAVKTATEFFVEVEVGEEAPTFAQVQEQFHHQLVAVGENDEFVADVEEEEEAVHDHMEETIDQYHFGDVAFCALSF
jgi:hypothetical protein